MDSDRLILGMAGNVPFYPPEEFLSPSILRRIKRALMDYRTTKVNDPMGKGAYFLLEGLAHFAKEHKNEAQLRMWGSVDSKYADEARRYGLSEEVEIGGFVPKEESMKRLGECDVMVLTLALGANGNPPFSLPGKMFDYFALGKPILALVEESYCTQVLRESGLAIVVDPKDKEAISNAILTLSQNRSTLSQDYRLQSGFLERFSHHRMVDQMADIFDSLV